MPIFDDPRKSLERMQRQLLREEEEYEEEEYLTDEEWLDEELAEAKALLEEEEPEEEEDEILYRNYANGYGAARQAIGFDELEEAEETEETEEPARPAKKMNGQLMLTFFLLAGIAAVAIYWVAVLL